MALGKRSIMQESTAPRVAIYFRMFGPYILARLNGAAARMPVTGIEGSRRSTAYAWEPREGEEHFERRTLFQQGSVDEHPPRAVIAAVRAALDDADPDVVCVMGWSYTEALATLGWALDHGRHAILLSESTAGDAVRQGWREAVKRWVVGLCDAALVGGEPQRAYVEALGMPADRVFIGYDAIDNDFFARGAAAALSDASALRAKHALPERYFLASCRFIEKKNLARLLDAFAAYRAATDDAPWDLVLVGDGDLRPMLEQQVKTLGIAGAVHFQGFKQYDDLPVFYGLAGGFVHVSTVEQWGLVVNEAMAAGLPVVVSRNCGCASDLVEEGANGWTVDPFDTTAITARLVEMASPQTDRQAMGERGRLIVAAFGPDRFGGGLVSAIAAARRVPVRRHGFLARAALWLLALRSSPSGK